MAVNPECAGSTFPSIPEAVCRGVIINGAHHLPFCNVDDDRVLCNLSFFFNFMFW